MMQEDLAQTTAWVRLAQDVDLPEIRSLMAPHIDAGLLRPRRLVASEFLVSLDPCGLEEEGSALLGTVGLAPWTPKVLELGSLVSRRRGQGSLLVLAALDRARVLGAARVVCLTGAPGFFSRLGFAPVGTGVPPHKQCAQGDAAVSWKAARCALCPDADSCTQTLMEVWL